MVRETVKVNTEFRDTFWREDRIQRGTFTFHCPIGILDGKPIAIHSKLGKIKQKNDGRWEWWMFKQKHFFRHYTDETKQGVTATKEEAVAIVEGPVKSAPASEREGVTYGEVSDFLTEQWSTGNEPTEQSNPQSGRHGTNHR